MKVRKEDLVSWISLILKKALTPSNRKARFRGSGNWPLNLQAMQTKMKPSETFIPRSAPQVAHEEEVLAKIMEENPLYPQVIPLTLYRQFERGQASKRIVSRRSTYI